jgi:ribosomal protein L29
MVERMELDDALMRVDNAITNASYVSERIQRLETLRENEEGDAWTKEEVDRQITELKERLAVVDVNIQKMQEDLWEIDDINYLKERLAVLESQVVTVDLSHVNSQIDEVRRIVADMWGPLTDVEQSVFSLEERVLLLENIGNHAKLIEKANKNR